MKQWKRCSFALMMVVGIILFGGNVFGFDFSSVKEKISEFTLDNGMKFIVMEDHSAPVVSFALQVNVGSANDPKEFTGMAHFFEHMAFKGTDEIGTKDYKKEKTALAKLDEVYDAMKAEQRRGAFADEAKIAELKEKFEKLQAQCDSLVEPNEFPNVIEMEGGVGLNAGTGADNTTYYYSLPSNKMELWFALESSRFTKPVFRQFYKEREVVKEERRMGTESSAQGKLFEEFLGAQYRAHPYGISIVGHMSDLNNMDKAAARKFYSTYYVASNMVAAMVGDINPDDAKKMAQKYFGKLPKVDKPNQPATIEPEQHGERRIVIEDPAQPLLIIGYHRPNGIDPDAPVFSALADYLGEGRTSLLYKDLVKEKKIAAVAAAFDVLLGDKFPSQFGVYALPSKGFSASDCEVEIYKAIERLKSEPIPAEELANIKARAKASLINRLSSRGGMANQLVGYQTQFNDWRELFNQLDKINAVTAEDCQRVAQKYLVKKNRTVGLVETVEAVAANDPSDEG